jgi:hypothetical protein
MKDDKALSKDMIFNSTGQMNRKIYDRAFIEDSKMTRAIYGYAFLIVVLVVLLVITVIGETRLM